MKTLTNNQVLITELILQEFEENNLYERVEDFFEYFSASQVLKSYDLNDDEIESGIKGAGLDGGCDGIYLFANNILINEDSLEHIEFPKDVVLELIIVQSKTSASFGEDAIMKWKTVSSNLLHMSNEISEYKGRYNEDILEAFQLFRDLYVKLLRKRIKLSFKYIYVSKAVDLHPNVLEQSDELKKIVKSLFPNSNVSVEFIGANELMELVNMDDITEYTLQLAENPISTGNKNDYVALVNLKDYFKFITDDNKNIIKNIFESNVRDYQGNVTVNSEIQETLQSQNDEDFWWLNNGITIIASEVIPMGGKIIKISDPEIVNGLQTSTEIYNYYKSFPDKLEAETRNVLVRAIIPSSEESRDNIILATNNQTQIPKASLRTTDLIHRQIEMYFKSRGLFYDRRKNYYKNAGKKPNEIVSVSFLAQCLISVLLQKPDYARARPSTIIADDTYYNRLYKSDIDLEVFYKLAVLGKKEDKVLKHLDEYSTVVKGDILFYVIYASIAKEINSVIIKVSDIKTLETDNITEEKIIEYARYVYGVYMELGGNGKVAKGPSLIQRLKDEL